MRLLGLPVRAAMVLMFSAALLYCSDDAVTSPDAGADGGCGTCSGCCVGDVCEPGYSDRACGRDGVACLQCSAGQVCRARRCTWLGDQGVGGDAVADGPSDGGRPDGRADGPKADAAKSDAPMDAAKSDTTVDAAKPDTTVDTTSPDTTVDALAPDTTVDAATISDVGIPDSPSGAAAFSDRCPSDKPPITGDITLSSSTTTSSQIPQLSFCGTTNARKGIGLVLTQRRKVQLTITASAATSMNVGIQSACRSFGGCKGGGSSLVYEIVKDPDAYFIVINTNVASPFTLQVKLLPP